MKTDSKITVERVRAVLKRNGLNIRTSRSKLLASGYTASKSQDPFILVEYHAYGRVFSQLAKRVDAIKDAARVLTNHGYQVYMHENATSYWKLHSLYVLIDPAVEPSSKFIEYSEGHYSDLVANDIAKEELEEKAKQQEKVKREDERKKKEAEKLALANELNPTIEVTSFLNHQAGVCQVKMLDGRDALLTITAKPFMSVDRKALGSTSPDRVFSEDYEAPMIKLLEIEIRGVMKSEYNEDSWTSYTSTYHTTTPDQTAFDMIRLWIASH